MKNIDGGIFLKIRAILPSLNPALRRIGNYVLNNPDKVKHMKIKELARECEVAESSITRFVKTLEFEGFQYFKILLADISPRQDLTKRRTVYNGVAENDSLKLIIDKIQHSSVEAIQNTIRIVDQQEIEKAVKSISRANNLTFYSIGNSTIAAENAKIRFYRIGKRCRVFSDPAQIAVSSSLLNKDDIVFGISYSGKTEVIVEALQKAKESGAVIIAVTNFDPSPILEYSDIKLLTSVKEADISQLSAVSRIAQLIVIDILYAAVAVKTFNKSVELIEKSGIALNQFLKNAL